MVFIRYDEPQTARAVNGHHVRGRYDAAFIKKTHDPEIPLKPNPMFDVLFSASLALAPQTGLELFTVTLRDDFTFGFLS